MPGRQSDVVVPRDESVGSAEQLLEALEELRRCIRAAEVLTRRSLREIQRGAGVAITLRTLQPAEVRQQMNDALKAVERARHQLRLAIFGAGLAEGMSASDLGKAYGFSRQLAARYAQEVRGAY
ncbi:MAG: hypothetical protein ACLQPH_16660 [Acidimicrobiales bacterium]